MAKTAFTAKFVGFERGHDRKIALKFDVINLTGGYVMAQCTTPPRFNSTGAAFKAARRAEAVIASTGKFPNFCAYF